MQLDRRLVGWGLFFIVLGLVPIALRAGLVSADTVSRWPLLWPLLLIGWGLGLILRRTPVDWLGGGITAITFGLMGGGLIASGFGGFPAFTSSCGSGGPGTAFEARSGTFSQAARMNVEFSCGSLAVGTTDGNDWRLEGVDAHADGPDVQGGGDAITLRTRDRTTTVFDAGRGKTSWNVSLPRGSLLDLGVTLNAGDGSIDLAGARLSSVGITLNAGSLDVRIADAMALAGVSGTVNAGSATVSLPGMTPHADFALNAGSLTVCAPAGSAVRIHWSGTLAANDFDEQGLVKVDNSTWTTSGFDAAQDHVELAVSANAGRFGLDLGGSCSA